MINIASVFSHLVESDSLATPWTVACHIPLSVGFSKQEYWSGLQFLSPGDFPDPGIEPTSLASPTLEADSLPLSDLDPNTKLKVLK